MAITGTILSNKAKINFTPHYFRRFNTFAKFYNILGIPETSDQEQIRTAYLALVKIYHPDSGAQEANADKFAEIDKAFKALIKKKSKERWQVEENINEDDNHDNKIYNKPQHRQYLSHEGYGSGTPFQRQKQYANIRAMQATQNVLEHRLAKAAATDHNNQLLPAEMPPPKKHKIQTKYGFDRLVEDLIQEAMSKGEFSNLSGTGKPLSLSGRVNQNPYVDFVTHKLNEVLIDNGFKPEWIMLHKEIRQEIRLLRDTLVAECKRQSRIEIDQINYKTLTQQINAKIDKFNLVVPILNKQMMRIDLDREAAKALNEFTNCDYRAGLENNNDKNLTDKDKVDPNVSNMFDFIEKMFRK